MIAKPFERTLLRGLLKPARLVFVCLSILIGTGALSLTTRVTSAQQGQPPSAQDELVMFFYKDPRPERLIGFFEQFDAAHPAKWDAYPAMAGLFAVVFREHPDRIEQLIPARLNPLSATTIAAALQLSGNKEMAAKLKPALDQVGRDEKLASEFANLPARLEDLSIRSPAHLDILWGAAYASGDARYVRMIIEFFAGIANRSERMALDIGLVAAGMAGGPKEIFGQLKDRYGANVGLVIVPAAALWATASNARRHAFIEQALSAYINENPGTYATNVLSAVRSKNKPP